MDAGTVVAVVTAVFGAGGIVTLVKIAVGSETRRANDWRSIAETATAAAERNGEHVRDLLAAVNQLAAAQREQLAILNGLQSGQLRIMELYRRDEAAA